MEKMTSTKEKRKRKLIMEDNKEIGGCPSENQVAQRNKK